MWSKLDGKQALSSALSKTYFGDKYIIVGEIYDIGKQSTLGNALY